MALSGTITTNDYNGRYYQLTWTAQQSIPNNTSTISWTIKCAGGQADWYAERTLKAVINGTTVYSKETRVERYAGTVATGTLTIGHAADGTKSFSVSLQVAVYRTSINCTGSGSFTLDTIARASQPSLVTWPETTNNVGSFGEEFAIHMNRASAAFTHTVRYEYGDRKGTIATGVGTGTTWAVPMSFINDIPNATSASGRIYVDTYNGSTLIGTKYTGFTVTVPASVKPTCTMTLEDVSGVGDIYGSPVQSLSKIKVTINATQAYSSPITEYSISANGATYNTATATTGELQAAGDSPVRVTVKDKRGRSGSASYTMKVLAYTPPSISALSVRRCNEDGTENDQGEFVRAQFNANATSLSSKNTATYTLKYRKSGTTNYTSVALTTYKNVYAVSGGFAIFPADSNSSYDVEITVADRHGSASRSTTASTAFTLMNWGANGTSFALGKVAEKSNSFEIGLRAYDQYGMHLSNGMSLYGGADNHIDPNTSMEHLILTNRNVPTANLWYVETIFYNAKLVTSDRRQTAVPYQRGGPTYSRYYTAGAWTAWESDALAAWPVGSIYIAYNHTNPGTLFGGTWTRIQNAFLWATPAAGTIGVTGGEQTVALTVDQLPSHSHGSVYSQHADGTKNAAWYTTAGSSIAYGAVATGEGEAHNNMPPYIQVSVWRRTA